jgi:hypothetical protein
MENNWCSKCLSSVAFEVQGSNLVHKQCGKVLIMKYKKLNFGPEHTNERRETALNDLADLGAEVNPASALVAQIKHKRGNIDFWRNERAVAVGMNATFQPAMEKFKKYPETSIRVTTFFPASDKTLGAISLEIFDPITAKEFVEEIKKLN